ncbi:MAG: hypothetical protein RBT36_04640 [Desulfobulbus sp.]|jgi:hypothetical protein|nr:hypothetical protein [Desulfobulbus sp.]
MLKFFPGIVLVQIITLGLMLIFPVNPAEPAIWSWLRLAAPVLVVALLTACWFGAMAAHQRKDAISHMQEAHARERETIRMQAERAKAKVLQQAHQETLQTVQRTSTRAAIKVGTAFAVLAAIGGALLLTQFITLGLLVLTAAGGAMGGYLLRFRQEKKRSSALGVDITHPPVQIETTTPTTVPEKEKGASRTQRQAA